MKNSSSFTLMEVMIALAILVGVVVLFSRAQINAVDRIINLREKFERINLMKKEMVKLFLDYPKTKKEIKVTIEQPDIKINAVILDIDKKSSLSGFANSISRIQIDGSWKKNMRIKRLSLIAFVLIPEEIRQKKVR